MQDTSYSLAEYKIIENEHGDLLWETHIGLGSLKSGKCLINGNILFIKPGVSLFCQNPGEALSIQVNPPIYRAVETHRQVG